MEGRGRRQAAPNPVPGRNSMTEARIAAAGGSGRSAPTPDSMAKMNFDESIRAVVARDDRYAPAAYSFLRDALDFTMKEVRDADEEQRHVSGPELLDGFRRLAINEFGPMAVAVLEDWGVRATRDVGNMVFNLIDIGIFGKSDEDSIEDFVDLFSFETAFLEPFRPSGIAGGARDGRPGSGSGTSSSSSSSPGSESQS